MKKLTILVPDEAEIQLNGTVIGLAVQIPGQIQPLPTTTVQPKPDVLPAVVYVGDDYIGQLKAGVKDLPNVVWCDITKIKDGDSKLPILHYGSRSAADGGGVRLMVPGENPSLVVAPDAEFKPIFPGISTPALPYGPPYPVPGESEISQYMRFNAMHLLGQQNAQDVLQDVYDSEAELEAAIHETQYQYKVQWQDGEDGAIHDIVVDWAQFGPASVFVKTPDGRVQRK